MTIKEIEIKSKQKVFVAVDGTEFDSAEECKRYEVSAEGAITARYVRAFGERNVPHGETVNQMYCGDNLPSVCACSDDYVFALTFRTQEDLDAFYMYTDLHNNSFTNNRHRNSIHFELGKTYIFSGYEPDDFYCCGEVEELKRETAKAYDHIAGNCRCRGCRYYKDGHCCNTSTFWGTPNEKTGELMQVNENKTACLEYEEREDK